MLKRIALTLLIMTLCASAFAQAQYQGDGSFLRPFALNQLGDDGWGLGLRVTGVQRAAAEAEQEAVAIAFDIECAETRGQACVVMALDLVVAGDSGKLYSEETEDPGRAWEVDAGSVMSGGISVMVDRADDNLLLLFANFPEISYTFPLVFATQDMVAAETIEITMTVGAVSRHRPHIYGGFHGVFRRGEQLMAAGRDEDGAWIQLANGGWLPAEFVSGDADLMALPITYD